MVGGLFSLLARVFFVAIVICYGKEEEEIETSKSNI
jgi:hypothetical protein